MGDTQNNDVIAIDLMVEQGLITKVQADKLKSHIKKGSALAEAVAKTPIVDPIKIASIQSLVAQRKSQPDVPAGITPAAIAETADLDDIDLEIDLLDDSEPIDMGRDKFRIKNHGPVGSPSAEKAFLEEKPTARADMESLDMVELPDRDPKIFEPTRQNPKMRPTAERLPTPESMAPTWPSKDIESDFDIETDLDIEGMGEEKPVDIDKKLILPTKRDQKEFGQQVGNIIDEAFQDLDIEMPPSAAQRKEPAKPESKPASTAISKLPPLTNINEYTNPSASQKTFDLTDDEGINLIREVNTILGKALDQKAFGVIIEANSAADNFKNYNVAGSLISEETIDPALLEKVVNRIKVMGRIETWRREQLQKGSFNLNYKGRRHHAYVHSENVEGSQRLVVYFENG